MMKHLWAICCIGFWLGLAGTAGATDFYLRPSGNDDGAGSEADPWRSLSKINVQNLEPGDRVLLFSGGSFTGTLTIADADSGTPVAPVVVTTYGGAEKASIASGTDKGISVYNASGVEISNLVVVAGINNETSGVEIYNDIRGDHRYPHIVLHNLEVHEYGKSGVDIGSWPYEGSGDTWCGYDNVRITHVTSFNNGKTDQSSAGIKAWGWWPAEQGRRNHTNWYIAHCLTYSNRKDGIVVSSVNGCTTEYCRAYANTGQGGVGIWYWELDNGVIQHSISHDNTSTNTADGGGFDLDGGCTKCVMQYNYSYSNHGAGYLMAQFNGATPMLDNVIRYNVSQNDGLHNNYGAIFFWSGDNDPVANTRIYGNTIYADKAPAVSGRTPSCVRLLSGGMTGNELYNNIFIARNGAKLVSIKNHLNGFTFKNNLYWTQGDSAIIEWGTNTFATLDTWRTASGQEVHNASNVGMQTDPQLQDPGNGARLEDPLSLTTLAAYCIAQNSPCIDAGLDLHTEFAIDPGPRDFYSNALPQGAVLDIGAHERAASTNKPPGVSITAPTNNAVFTVPTDILLAADASDHEGSIVRVEFYYGTNSLGQDTSEPYTLTWTGATTGAYALTAVATDDEGAAATSTVVSITVNEPSNQPPAITINPNSSAAIRTDGIGVNMDNKLISDAMWEANGQWIRETYLGTGIRFMRWGDPLWNWEQDSPLSFGMWTKYNTRDDAGIRGLDEFLDYCKATDTTPLIITPVRTDNTPDYAWTNLLAISRRMAEYVDGLNLRTPVYFSLGNEPENHLTQNDYETRIADFGPMIHGIDTNFKVIVRSHNNYIETQLVANVGHAYDGIDRHEYTAMGTGLWNNYYKKDNDNFFKAFGAARGGKETILGECNTLWPDWFLGPMANDLKGALTLINGCCFQVDRRNASHITPWPSLWPSDGDTDPYGMFNYDEWTLAGQTRLFTGPVWAKRMVNENILTLCISDETSDDAKVRVFAYTDATKSQVNAILINKHATNRAVTVNTTLAFDYVNMFVFQGNNINDQAPDYLPQAIATTIAGSTSTHTLPPQSATVLQFYNDVTTDPPAAFSLSEPTDGTTHASTYKLFRWTAAADARNYRLIVARDAGYNDVVFDRQVGPLTQYQIIGTNLCFDATYYWKVEAANRNGLVAASNSGISFTTAPAPVVPELPRNLRNGDFEHGYAGWVDWGSMSKTDEPGNVYAGTYSGEIGPAEGGCGQDLFGMTPGDVRFLRFMFRQQHMDDVSYAGIDYYDKQGVKVGEQEWMLPYAAEYREFVVAVTNPPQVWRGQFWFWKTETNGLLLIDEAFAQGCQEDADSDGLENAWEWLYSGGTSITELRADADQDGDGADNLAECIAGTDPTTNTSVFTIRDIAPHAATNGTILSWTSVTGRIYSVCGQGVLSGSITCLFSNLPATPPQNACTARMERAQQFYHLRVRRER